MLKATLNSEQTDRLVRPLAAIGLSGNSWTLLSIVPAICGLAALIWHQLLLGLLLFAASGAIDMVDGAIARARNEASSRGAFIDGVVDRYVELLLCLGLLFYLGPAEFLGLPAEAWFVLLVFGSLMTSFVRAYADNRGLVKDPAQLKKMGGLLERGERFLLLYAGMLGAFFNPQWLMAAVALAAALANLTALQRVAFALKKKEKGS